MKQFLLIVFIICTSLTTFGQEETACTQTVNGEVRDGISTNVLVGAQVVLTNDTGAIIEVQRIKEDGKFSFTIKCETFYKIEGRQKEYTPESKSFTSTNETGKALKLLILLDKGNIDFITDGEANAKTIDSVAKAEVVVLEVAPEVVVEKEEPVIQQEVVQKKLPVVKPKKVISSNNEIKINPIYFDYESSWLNEKIRRELQKVVGLMRQNPNMVLKCEGHTDAKGEEDYNQWMSDRRAKRVVDYIIGRGIASSRISGKGFGETRLVNNCTNEVACTDAQRAANRRTEFIIVKM